MLRRLISAVFVIGLVLAFSGTATSDVTKGELNPVIKIDQNNERYVNIADARPAQPSFKKPESALKVLPSGLTAPSTPQAYFCDVQDYTNGVPYYFWPIPDAYGDDLFNMRFTSDAGYDCTLMVGHYLMYGTAMVGAPDLRCYLWDDDGFGFPNNKLDSVDILNASLPTSGIAYVSADFTPAGNASGLWWVFSDGDEYHLGWTILDNSGAGTDVLAIISDDATGSSSLEERASENWGGMWGTMLNDWLIDVSFFILAERCCSEIPYSDCYWQGYPTNLAYLWRAPHPVWGDVAYSMRMSVTQAETLQVIDVGVYDDATGLCGNDDVIMTVYDDDGTGLPGTQLAQTTIPGGGYAFYPAYTTFNFGLVMIPAGMPGANLSGNDFHVAFSSSAILGSGDYEACLSSDGTDGVGRSASDWGGGTWVDMLTGWGLDCNFLFYANLCKDPFKDCYWDWCYVSLDYFWRLPDAYGDWAHAQKFTAQGEECQVHEVAWALYDNGTPTAYTTTSEVQVYTDAGGLPGTKMAGILIGPGTGNPYVLFPSMMSVDFGPLNVLTSGDYWVAIESHGTDSTDGIRTLSDAGGGSCVDSWAEYWGAWSTMCTYWGIPCDANAIVEERQCCIPYGGMVCVPSEDWPTYQRDYARTGHSMNAISDAWCDLTMYWNYEDPAQGISWCGPIVAYDKVVQAFTDHYIVFDLNPASPPTASIVYTLSGFPLGGALRCTPTVAMIAGITDPVLFVGGGDQQSFVAYDLYTGALIWSRDISTVGTAGLFGLNRWGRTVILNIGGMDVLYWGTDDGNVVAVEAANGSLYFGWGTNNPVPLTYSVNVSGTTDGTDLFFCTYIGTGGPEGDVYSIDAATGVINWQLSGPPPAGGLQGVNVFTHTNGYPIANEGFAGGIMYDNGKIYTPSRAEADHPTDGLFYSINASDGSLNYAVLSNRAYYQTPIMDISHVYLPTTTRWGTPPAGGNMIKFNKNSGAIEGVCDGPGGGRYYAHDAAATCEPEPEPDFIVAVDDDGFLQFIRTSDMTETFRRKIDNGIGWPYDMGQGVAVVHDVADEVHVLATCYWGNLIDLTKQGDRARLEIQTYNPTTAVEFGSNPLLPVSIPDVFVNTGCTDLQFLSICADQDAAACACDIQSPTLFASVNTVGVDFMEKASRIADNLARDAYLSKYLRPSENVLDENLIISRDEMDLTKERSNSAATAWPPFVVSIDFPAVGLTIAPGDTADLDLTVDQLQISRGPQCFYMQMVTNDPDFYINNVTMDPCIYVCLVGGCLIDTTTLWFGMGCTDYQWVTNTGRIGTGDWDAHCFDIDGDAASYYQAAYVYATSTHRMAVHTQDWTTGGGEADAFVSMQPDPNWCDGECKPHLMSGVTLLGCMGGVGGITSDGITYTPVVGDMVCKSFLDSVQIFNATWDNFGVGFDNDSTMGLYVESRVVGVCDVPELDNVTIEIMEFHNRNNDSVTGWYLGEILDCDNGGDELGIDRDISTTWSHNTPGNDQAWGQVKIPFGCISVGQTAADNVPILNIWDEWGVSGTPGHGFWGWGIFWDFCYIHMSHGVGHFSEGVINVDIHNGDEEAMMTYASHDFEPYGDYEVAIAHFALFGLADASDGAEYAGMAHMVNKFCGWERGDVNNDGTVGNLCDIIYLANFVNTGAPGPIPFMHLGDVVIDGTIDMLDVNRLIDYYFGGGPCPDGAWCF
ncbi:MAG: hypothetical protein ABII79_02760 [bacterium]